MRYFKDWKNVNLCGKLSTHSILMALLIFFLSNSRKQTPDFPTNLISVLQNEGVYVQNLEQLRAVEEVRMKLKAAELRRQFKENMEALEQNDVKSDDDDEEIESALNGFNSTIFAYGQTASGMTHTMLGSKVDPGIMRHAVDHIFDAIEQTPDKQFLLRVSYMEIYNEQVTDLLANGKVKIKSCFCLLE